MSNIKNLTAEQISSAPRKWAICDIDDRRSFVLGPSTQVGVYNTESEAAKDILDSYLEKLEDELKSVKNGLSTNPAEFLQKNNDNSVEILDCVIEVLIGPCGNAFTQDGEYIPFDS